MTAQRVVGAIGAQISGQICTGLTLAAHIAGWPEVSIWVIAFLLVAAVVPFRHDGSFRDRAAGNFGAGIVLSGFLWWEVLFGGLEGVLGGKGFSLGLEALLMLTASVLFAVAGALFWTLGTSEAEE